MPRTKAIKGSVRPEDEPLTWKERMFVLEYGQDFNATQAYKRAGYYCKNDAVAGVQGHRLLKKPRVRKAIDELLQERKDENQLNDKYVLGTLKEVTEKCMQRLPVKTPLGNEMLGEFDAGNAIKAVTKIGEAIGTLNPKNENQPQYHQHNHIHLLENMSFEQREQLRNLLRNTKNEIAPIPLPDTKSEKRE